MWRRSLEKFFEKINIFCKNKETAALYKNYVRGRVINPKESENRLDKKHIAPLRFSIRFFVLESCRLFASYIARLYRIVQ